MNMPSKLDNIPINNPEHDKRVKLTDEQRENIREEYKTGSISIRALERKYGVSRRLIQFILFPERYEKAKRDLRKGKRKEGITIKISIKSI